MAKKEKNIKPEKNKKSKKEGKNKRRFFKDFKAELKKVVWPTPKQLLNSTIAVVTIVVVVGIIVFLLDMGFEFINSKGINKLQVKLQETYINTATDTNKASEQENTDVASNNVSNAENTTQD